MNQEWNDFLVQQGANPTWLDFGSPIDEVKHAQSASIMVPLQDLGIIRATGADATSFLHNLLTNDVEALAPNAAGRFGLCTPKGRLLATFLVWRENDDYLLALSADLHAAILKKLSMYVLRSKVKLTDATQERLLIGLAGTLSTTALGQHFTLPSAPLSTTHHDTATLIQLGEERHIAVIKATAEAGGSETACKFWSSLHDQAHIPPAGLPAWHWLDIMAGIPQITLPTQEEFIPQMINYEVIGGVSFKKGCYPGQEIVARTQYLGKVKRRMYRAHLETGTPQTGMTVFSTETGEQSCGMVVTAAPAPQGGHDALLVIPSNCAETGQLHLGTTAGALMHIQPLPYAV